MTDVAKPGVGETVQFFDPGLTARIGFATGYSGRGVGPYAGLVVNDNGPGLDIIVFYPAKQPAFVHEQVRENPHEPVTEANPKPYWDYTSAAQKARAVKALNEREKAREGDAA